MTTTTRTIDIVREHVGRRSRITRDEMHAILVALGREHVDLRNVYVPDTVMWDQDRGASTDAALDQPGITRAAIAWTRTCQQSTLVSVDARGGLRDGYVRYDEPGRIPPDQQAELTFVSAACAERTETLDYLRQHARRVLVVTGEPEPPPDAIGAAEPADPRETCECAQGHRWTTDDPERDWQCPTCGECWC